MTPQEKAIELTNIMFTTDLEGGYMGYAHITIELAKKLALICVDEIIKANPIIPLEFMLESEALDKANEYWQEVKSEIEKI